MGLKDWLLRSGRNSGSADIAGCYADIQRWEELGRCAGNSPGCVSRRVLQCATPTAIPRAS